MKIKISFVLTQPPLAFNGRVVQRSGSIKQATGVDRNSGNLRAAAAKVWFKCSKISLKVLSGLYRCYTIVCVKRRGY